MPEAEGLVLDMLRSMRTMMERQSEDIREPKSRMTALEGQMAGLYGMYAGVSSRLDRLDARWERVDRRLDLVEA